MSWEVQWTDRARKDLRRLDIQNRQRVIRAVEQLAETEHGNIKTLAGKHGERRLRVGGWRVRYVFDPTVRSIRILHVLPRDRAYRD